MPELVGHARGVMRIGRTAARTICADHARPAAKSTPNLEARVLWPTSTPSPQYLHSCVTPAWSIVTETALRAFIRTHFMLDFLTRNVAFRSSQKSRLSLHALDHSQCTHAPNQQEWADQVQRVSCVVESLRTFSPGALQITSFL